MDSTQPGLFDVPDEERSSATKRRAARGRNREAWALTATAAVTIVDAAAVQQAATQDEGFVLATESGADPVAGESESSTEEDLGALDALAWQIWPTVGLEELLEAGAFTILSIDSEVKEEAADQGTATWTATVKLTDVDELRRIATLAHPEDEALIADSLEIAWQHAIDPFAPLRPIPGIGWRPGEVHVEHRHARPTRGS